MVLRLVNRDSGRSPPEEDPKQKEELDQVLQQYVVEFTQPKHSNEEPQFVEGGILDLAKGEYIPSKSSSKYTISSSISDSLKNTHSNSIFSDTPNASTSEKFGKAKPKTREIDLFMAEIQKKHQAKEGREQLSKPVIHPKSDGERSKTINKFDELPDQSFWFKDNHADSDRSTNLYIGNLSTEATEEFLCQQFGKHGTVKSVKIMYPRSEEEKIRGRNCGFVSFEQREQAEAAKNALDGTEFFGMVVRIGWGKAIGKYNSAAPTIPPTTQPGNLFVGMNDAPNQCFDKAPIYTNGLKPIEVPVPEDKRVKMLIDLISKFVAEDGIYFEKYIMEREKNNERFKFMLNHRDSLNCYYRWRVYAFAQGDTCKSWRLEPFQMQVGGALWIPPSEKYFLDHVKKVSNSIFDKEKETTTSVERSAKSNKRRLKTGETPLPETERVQFEGILANLNFSRQSILEAMVFCLDNVSSAFEIIEMLIESLHSNVNNLDKVVSRLFLISDILHNSSSTRPFAWVYRAALEKSLPFMFERLQKVYKFVNGRLAGKKFCEAVHTILNVWETWAVYSPLFTRGLECNIFGDANFQEFIPDHQEIAELEKYIDEDIDGQPLENNLHETLIRYPQFLRSQIREWLLLDPVQLVKISEQRGLPANSLSKYEIIDKLVTFDLYWFLKNLKTNVMLSRKMSEDIIEEKMDAIPVTTAQKPLHVESAVDVNIPPVQPNAITNGNVKNQEVETATNLLEPIKTETVKIENDECDDIFAEPDELSGNYDAKVVKDSQLFSLNYKKHPSVPHIRLQQVESQIAQKPADLTSQGMAKKEIELNREALRQEFVQACKQELENEDLDPVISELEVKTLEKAAKKRT